MAQPDPAIIHRLFEAMELRSKLPAFRRGRMYFDFETGKVRIAEPAPT